MAVLVKVPDCTDHDLIGRLCAENSSYKVFEKINYIWIENPKIQSFDSENVIRWEFDEIVSAPTPEILDIQSDPLIASGDAYAHSRIGTKFAWDAKVRGDGLPVAVLDTGVEFGHEDFDNLGSGLSYDGTPTAADDNGHGTAVSGAIASLLNNAVGGAGVAPESSIHPFKVLNANNVGRWSWIISAILQAHANGHRVANLSLGSSGRSMAVEQTINAVKDEMMIVAAAGNSATESPFYPAAYDGVLSVGATDRDDLLWALSNRGEHVDIYAPGAQIIGPYLGGGYAYLSGTSLAAPHVAGAAALLMGRNPEMTPAQCRSILMETATVTGDGLRLLNVEAAVRAGVKGIVKPRIFLPFVA